MRVIAHQTVAEQAQEHPAVGIVEENLLLVVTDLRDVMRHPDSHRPRDSSHTLLVRSAMASSPENR